MEIKEIELTEEYLNDLIELSANWEAESSCRGYRANARADIEGRRVFAAFDGGRMIGYLFGKIYEAANMTSIMPDNTPYFETDEVYVAPDYRSKGIGKALFRHVEEVVKPESKYIVLSTATKNWRAIFHFYIDELGMDFWNARLFKRIEGSL